MLKFQYSHKSQPLIYEKLFTAILPWVEKKRIFNVSILWCHAGGRVTNNDRPIDDFHVFSPIK